jgi:glycosyltransferase involved in cell wall biosynthesis
LGITLAGQPSPYLLHVGTLQPRKNLVRLLEAYAAIRHHHPDLKLVLAGRLGWLSRDITDRIDTLDLQEWVICPGFVQDQDLAPLLSGAQAFVFPSLYEGFGLPILEAQACGVPVIAANTSSLPEVAGKGALLVNPLDTAALAQAIEQVLANQDLRQQLREAGFANCARFSWERCARETLAVLERCGPQAAPADVPGALP